MPLPKVVSEGLKSITVRTNQKIENPDAPTRPKYVPHERPATEADVLAAAARQTADGRPCYVVVMQDGRKHVVANSGQPEKDDKKEKDDRKAA